MRGFNQWRGSGVVLALLALAGCDEQKVTGPMMVYKGPIMETTNVLTLYSDSAKLKLQVSGPLQQQFENGDIIYPKGVKIIFYSADGKKTVVNTITAKYGKSDKAKTLYTMRGDVRVANVVEAQKLNTEELFFDTAKQLIYTDSAMFVKVETPTEYIDGYGLKANQNFSRYSIKRPTGIIAKAVGTGL